MKISRHKGCRYFDKPPHRQQLKETACIQIHRTINIRAFHQRKDSVLAGLDIMKRYKVFITKGSVNLIREFKNYNWKEDQAGKATKEPID